MTERRTSSCATTGSTPMLWILVLVIADSCSACTTRVQFDQRMPLWVGTVPYSHLVNRTWGYPTDCSGYVSWALDVGNDVKAYEWSATAYSTPIDSDQLRHGDLVTHVWDHTPLDRCSNRDARLWGGDGVGSKSGSLYVAGHVIVFDKWDDDNHTSYWAYESTETEDQTTACKADTGMLTRPHCFNHYVKKQRRHTIDKWAKDRCKDRKYGTLSGGARRVLPALLCPEYNTASHHPVGHSRVAADHLADLVVSSPGVASSRGRISPILTLWPQPQHVGFESPATMLPLAAAFTIDVQSDVPEVLLEACQRYLDLVRNTTVALDGEFAASTTELASLVVRVIHPSVALKLGVDESFNLTVPSSGNSSASLVAETVWGAMRGLETFSQLVGTLESASRPLGVWGGVRIRDAPRFAHRELLVDTARYFFDANFMLHVVEAMEYSKLNVLHWHIVDAQSFPLESERFPLLAQKGAFRPHSYFGCFLDKRCTYSKADVAAVVAHARARGIRVIAEFDTPGHSASWGKGYPNTTLSGCTRNLDSVPLNPAEPFAFELVGGVLTEMTGVGGAGGAIRSNAPFDDAFVHIGGDEVDLSCFEEDEVVAEYLAAHNLSAQGLVDEWSARVHAHVDSGSESQRRRAIVWEESLTMCNNNASTLLAGESVVQVWKSPEALLQAASLELGSIYSYGWYVNKQSTFADFYNNDPFAQGAWSDATRAHVLGGGVSKWGCSGVCLTPDTADKFDGKVWVPAIAVAERLWSAVGPQNVSDDGTVARAQAHRARLISRGVKAGPFK